VADLLTFERFCQFQRNTVADDEEVATRIGNYIKAVCAWARWKVGCDLSTATRTARLSGTGGNLLYPPFWPITSVVSLGVSYGLGSVAWTVLQGTDPDSFQWVVLRPDGHCLMARYRPWPEGYGNILLTAVSGYAENDPEVEDLIQALCMATALCVNEEQMIGEGSKSGVGPETVQLVVRNLKDYQVIMDAIYHHRQHY
jgi:hypothetical protein